MLVANGGWRPSGDPLIETVIVSQGADVADDWIVEHARPNDIVITADVPLASRAVPLGVHVLEAHPPTVATAMTEGMRRSRTNREHSAGRGPNTFHTPRTSTAGVPAVSSALIARPYPLGSTLGR